MRHCLIDKMMGKRNMRVKKRLLILLTAALVCMGSKPLVSHAEETMQNTLTVEEKTKVIKEAKEKGYITPEMCGCDDKQSTDDSQAFYNIFDLLQDPNLNLTDSIPMSGGYDTGNFTVPTIVLTGTKTYKINSALLIKCPVVKIQGNGATIISDNDNRIFDFKYGYKTEIDDVEFFKCTEPIYFEWQNLEAGRITITNCAFHQCKGYTITTDRRSCIVTIKDNNFTGCERYWWSNNNDMAIFEGNWCGFYTLSDEYKAPIKVTREPRVTNGQLERTDIDEFTCKIRDNVFVPTKSSYKGLAWIDCSVPDMTIENNRFGGEPGSLPIVNVLEGMTAYNDPKDADKGKRRSTGLRIINNFTDNLEGGYKNSPNEGADNSRMINLKGLPSLIEVTGNRGFYYFINAIMWDPALSEEDQTALINNVKESTDRPDFIKIIIYGNSGYHVDYKDEINDNVPANLLPYVNQHVNVDDLSDYIKNIEDYVEENEELKEEYDKVKDENDKLKNENEELKEEYNKVKDENEKLKEDKTPENKDDSQDKTNDQVNSSEEAIKKENELLKNEIEKLKTENNNLKAENEKLKKENITDASKVTKDQLLADFVFSDKKSKGIYKISKVTVKNGLVTGGSIIFVKPLKKTYKKASIPSYIKLAGKKFYVTEIGSDAFDGCSKVKTVTIKSKKITSFGQNAFKGINSKAKIKVPKSKYKKYKKMIQTSKVSKKTKITKY